MLGGAGMAFHYKLLSEIMGDVPPTLAVGDPVSGKSTEMEAALSLFDQRKCIGGILLLSCLISTTFSV